MTSPEGLCDDIITTRHHRFSVCLRSPPAATSPLWSVCFHSFIWCGPLLPCCSSLLLLSAPPPSPLPPFLSSSSSKIVRIFFNSTQQLCVSSGRRCFPPLRRFMFPPPFDPGCPSSSSSSSSTSSSSSPSSLCFLRPSWKFLSFLHSELCRHQPTPTPFSSVFSSVSVHRLHAEVFTDVQRRWRSSVV